MQDSYELQQILWIVGPYLGWIGIISAAGPCLGRVGIILWPNIMGRAIFRMDRNRYRNHILASTKLLLQDPCPFGQPVILTVAYRSQGSRLLYKGGYVGIR